MSRAERLAMLEKDHPEISLKVQANLLGISYSSLFYEAVPPSLRELAIKRHIDKIYTDCPFYGSRKIAFLLRPEFGVSRPTVQAYMREMGIFALVPGPHTSNPAPQHQIYPYLLRNVTAAHPNHIWGIDITYIRLQHGWLYLTAVLDWYSRYVVSWALSQTLEMDFVLTAVDNAGAMAPPNPKSGIATKAVISPARNIWSACNARKSKSAWMDAGAQWTIFLPKDCGARSSTRKSICMNMPAQRRLITS
jgi:putative transposase